MGDNDYYAELILGVEHFLEKRLCFLIHTKVVTPPFSTNNDALVGQLPNYSERESIRRRQRVGIVAV